MRHLKHRHQLGRTKEHRAALMANLAAALVRHGRMRTTLAKAKALRPFAEKLITLAKRAQDASPEAALHLRRQAIARLRDKDAAHILFHERAAQFAARPGGYTRILKLGSRLGDAAEMAIIELIAADDEGYGRKRRGGGKKAKPEPEAAVPEADKPDSSEETESASPEENTTKAATAEAETAETPADETAESAEKKD